MIKTTFLGEICMIIKNRSQIPRGFGPLEYRHQGFESRASHTSFCLLCPDRSFDRSVTHPRRLCTELIRLNYKETSVLLLWKDELADGWMNKNVSEKHSVSIFRAKVSLGERFSLTLFLN